MKKFFILVCAAALALVACDPAQKQEAAKFDLTSEAEVAVGSTGGEVVISFTTNVAWTAKMSAGAEEWISTETAMQGEGDGTITLKVAANEEIDTRSAKISFKSEELDITATVIVRQAEKGAITAKKSYSIGAKGGELSIDVEANVDYTVVSRADWIKVAATKGMEKSTIKVTVDENTAVETRSSKIVISAGAAEAEVAIEQEGAEPFFEVDTESLIAPVAGDSFVVLINTNVEYTAVADGAAWANFSIDADKLNVTCEANPAYSSRTSFITFTVPSIQVDAHTDDDPDLTEDYTVSVYLTQEGNASINWAINMLEGFQTPGRYNKIAVTGDFIFQANENGVYVYGKDGKYLRSVDAPDGMVFSSIAADEAGNLVAFTFGEWHGANIYGLRFKASDIAAGQVKGEVLVNYINDYYGLGISNVRVGGNVYGDAVITAICASTGGISRATVWEIKDGSATWSDLAVAIDYGTEEAPDVQTVVYKGTAPSFYAIEPLGGEINVWDASQVCVAPAGKTLADGMYFAGYDDGNYDFWYGTSDENWKVLFNSGGDWTGGVDCIKAVEWNGRKYVAYVMRSFFAVWWCPSYIRIWDVTDQANCFCIYEEAITNDGFLYSEYADGDQAGAVNTDIDAYIGTDGALNVVFLEGNWGIFASVKFPVI